MLGGMLFNFGQRQADFYMKVAGYNDAAQPGLRVASRGILLLKRYLQLKKHFPSTPD